MVKFADFSNVFGIAFGLNVLVTYIQDIRKRSSRELTETISSLLQDFKVDPAHPLNADIVGLQQSAVRNAHRLSDVANVMSGLTFVSSATSLGVLIYAGFNPKAIVSIVGMSLLLMFLLLVPLVALAIAHFSSNLLKLALARSTQRLLPKLEAAGFNRKGIIRLEEVARLFSSLNVRRQSNSLVLSLLDRLWARLRRRHVIVLEGPEAEDAMTRLGKIAKETGKSVDETAALALGLVQIIAENMERS